MKAIDTEPQIIPMNATLKCIKIAEEMAQRLRAHSALPEDLGLIPNTHII